MLSAMRISGKRAVRRERRFLYGEPNTVAARKEVYHVEGTGTRVRAGFRTRDQSVTEPRCLGLLKPIALGGPQCHSRFWMRETHHAKCRTERRQRSQGIALPFFGVVLLTNLNSKPEVARWTSQRTSEAFRFFRARNGATMWVELMPKRSR